MSTLQVSNVHLESTANNRIEYAGSNTVNIYAGGINVLSANSSGLSSLQVLKINLEGTANNRIEYGGSNTVNIFAGGINVLSANSSGLLVSNVHLEGTANNRIEYAGSNTVNIYAGGTNILSANSSTMNIPVSGSIAIGNTTVNSTVNSTSISIGSNNLTVGTSAYFVSNGNVGIDTSDPTSTLHVISSKVGSSSNWYDPANYAATIHHDINSTSRYGLLVSNRWRASENFVFAVDGRFTNGGGTVAEDTHTPYFIVRGDGNVGIGTNTPSEKLEIVGNVTPGASNTYDLGTSSLRWRNIYTNDLNLNNGIGDYTIVEGEDDLFLYNNKKGKVYKFALVEVDPSEAPKKAT